MCFHFLYASPQSLKDGSFWYKCLFELASKNLIRLICIDEAHSVAQDGRNFRPEFRSAVKTLRSIYDAQTTKCNRIAMSATFRQCNQDVITDLFGRPPDKVMWLELARRRIHFDVIISGNPLSAVTSSAKQDYKHETDMQTIVYTNSKQQAVGSISAAMESLLENSPNDGDVIPLTGDDGLQFKVFTMHAFSQDIDGRGSGGKNVMFSNAPNSTFECFNIL